jgi:hypothetical protein
MLSCWIFNERMIYRCPKNGALTVHYPPTFESVGLKNRFHIAESGDSKSKKFLFERISLAIQRGNAASIRGTFPDSALLSEIFAL